MNKGSFVLTCSVIALLATACESVTTGPSKYGKPYTATYEQVTGGRHLQFTVAADGQGRFRFDGSGAPVQGMNDYSDGKHYEFNAAQKRFYARPLSSDDTCMDEATIKAGSATTVLGERTIAGHECRGYSPNGKAAGGGKLDECWFDKDTGALMSETALDRQINLLDFKSTPPAASLFTIPKDWQMSLTPVG